MKNYLHSHVEICIVFEGSKHVDNKGKIDSGQNLLFIDSMLDLLELHNFGLFENFESDGNPICSLLCNVNAPKRSRPQSSHDLKIDQRYTLEA
jgi:hypothetical protein